VNNLIIATLRDYKDLNEHILTDSDTFYKQMNQSVKLHVYKNKKAWL